MSRAGRRKASRKGIERFAGHSYSIKTRPSNEGGFFAPGLPGLLRRENFSWNYRNIPIDIPSINGKRPVPFNRSLPTRGRRMAQNDAEYIKKCKEGDTEAFAELVRRYMRLVYVAAYGYVKDEHIANDMAQEAFLKAFRSLGGLKKPEHFGAWLVGIVKSVCIDRIRKEKGRGDAAGKNPRPAEVSLESILEGYGSISASPEGDISAAESRPSDFAATHNSTPPAALNTHALRRAVLQKINELPQDYRQLLLLKHIQNVSYEDIQKILKTSYSSVVTRLFRARQALKEKLEPILKNFM